MITKRLYQLLITMLLLCPLTLQAQVINQDDDEEDEVALNDTIDIDDDFPDLEEIVVIGEDEDGEEEEIVIDMPEALTLAVDSLLDLYHTQAYLQVDSTCNLPDYNPEYDREVYIERLQQLPTVIEMPYNDIVRQFIDRYSGRLRRSVSIMLGQQNFYMPIFEQALETYGLPLELRYLPIIESALKPNAVSRVGAAGLWQFMIATGKQYGLEVTSLVDERRDPIKSSNAAARYLKTLYKIFGDWHLVIAAYNCGPENVNKAVHRAGGVKDYWHIYPYLPAETRGYVPAFIAANYIMNYYCEHNICPMLSSLPAKTDTLVLNRDVHFEQIAGVLGVDVKLIEELNPQYRR
ncbi:MAG: lytic transglycosylase domain-containing protein, partial [Prevotella sp.]|nr:lytic transglycosylase domain-containing protein [Prevotella sp.]